MKKSVVCALLLCVLLSVFSLNVESSREEVESRRLGPLVKRKHRRSLVETEYGEVSAANVSDGTREAQYHLQFITLEPNSLFLPVLLHADTVFYVHTGSGELSWADEEEMNRLNLKRGDIFRLNAGFVFLVQSNLEPDEREKLRLYAIFSNTDEGTYEPSIGAYSRIGNLVRGFDEKVLQSAFKVSKDAIETLQNATKTPQIVHAVQQKKKTFSELEARFLKAFMAGSDGSLETINKKKKTKTRTFNILDAKPDFENCNGWSATVTGKDLKLLKGSNIGVFMVNLTKGSMMGPHWNPKATEIAVVLHGQGMVRVVCSSSAKESGCKNMRFSVKEGDVFAVPRFHPMAQMSFNNDSFVFMGFSTTTKTNYPQFLAGARSVLHSLDKEVLAVSFNVSNTTIDHLLTMQKDSIILECTSCAEEEESKMEEEIEKEREEEEARKREEEQRKREEEEEREREREEEEARKREEEQRKREEEEEIEREREEEEARKREEEEEEREREREREEEEARKKEEEERKREEEEEEEEERREREREKEERREREREEEEAAERDQEEGGDTGRRIIKVKLMV